MLQSTSATSKLKHAAQHMLRLADVEIGGDRSWDIQLRQEEFYERIIADGSLGLGESYMDGWWEVERLDELICRFLRARLHRRIRKLKLLLPVLQAKMRYRRQRPGVLKEAASHYELGNDLFERMLDRRMVYTCGYWRDADNLDDAQLAKLELVCRKIGLEAGMRVLDVGCGWGGFAKYAAEEHGAQVVGVTTSRQQADYARALCSGLPVEIRLEDYRSVDEPFDRIISLGMFEHVGHAHHRVYMEMARRCLHEDGLFLLQTIGDNATTTRVDPWMSKYIFPDGDLPSLAQITRAVEGLFVVEDLHNFGAYYDKTLMAWFANFDRAWDRLRTLYDQRFYRMWKFYLLSCAGAFRARHVQLWQIVFAPRGKVGGYARVCG